jgi:2-iminobutanoate/2-iminopropanoate deaminase
MRKITPANGFDPDVPLSMGIEHDDVVYVSGQAAFDPETGDVVGDTVADETTKTLENVASVLESAGASLDDVVKTQVFLTDVDDFDEMNGAYREMFSEPYPARSAFEIGDLAADIRVEIEAIAVTD